MSERRGSGRRHHHSKRRRIRHWLKYNKKLAIFIAVFAVVILGGSGILAHQMEKTQSSRHVTSGNSVNMASGYRNITYNGKNYQYNSLITTVLFVGIDSEGEMDPGVSYTMAPRADSINLVILDKKHKKMTIMALNRDTMTEIRRYTVNGTDRGTYVSHLGLAFTYGEGGKASCENVREAVSNLLGGIPINEYAVVNRSSMSFFNDLVGGVTVTVPNNDLAEADPRFYEGAQVTLDDTNIELYLRRRDIEESFSNEGRIQRQQSYMTAYIDKFKQLLQDDLNGTWNKMAEMEGYLQTSITKNKYLKLANLLDTVSFTPDDYYLPEGQDLEGELHDEFYVDEAALQEKVIELFYEEI